MHHNTILYDIIIPHFGIDGEITDLACNCLGSIHNYSRDYRIILVDNGTPKEEFDKLEPYIDDRVEVIHLKENQGFVKAVNIGLLYSTAPYIVICNNDIEAVPDWLSGMRKVFDLVPEVGLVGPRTTTPNCWQGNPTIAPEGYLVLPRHCMLAFFCVMMRREVLEQVGYLDERYGVGLGDDDDYCYRVHEMGFRICLDSNLVIPHYHRSTFKKLFSDGEIDKMIVGAHRTLIELGHHPQPETAKIW